MHDALRPGRALSDPSQGVPAGDADCDGGAWHLHRDMAQTHPLRYHSNQVNV